MRIPDVMRPALRPGWPRTDRPNPVSRSEKEQPDTAKRDDRERRAPLDDEQTGHLVDEVIDGTAPATSDTKPGDDAPDEDAPDENDEERVGHRVDRSA
ncbi:MAG: hypothetical protein V3V17_06335 [Alphaproteobacteria bacterium]